MAPPVIDQKIINKLTAEDIVIVISIVITLLLAPLLSALWFLDKPILIPPPIISIFLGIAVSALLYRFLGGVHDASFTVGALKVTGTAAILIFVSWWANGELKHYVPNVNGSPEVFDITKHSIPSYEKWFAVNKNSGEPIQLDFPAFNQKHDPPTLKELNLIRKDRDLGVNFENDQFVVYLKNSGNQVLGSISPNEINQIGYYENIKMQLVAYRVVEFGATENKDINANLPFKVATRGFSENYTQYALISKNDGLAFHEGAILLRGAEVIEYEKHYYLISVVQVNHIHHESRAPYAKIYVAEIKINRE